jgi:hypothetical protein
MFHEEIIRLFFDFHSDGVGLKGKERWWSQNESEHPTMGEGKFATSLLLPFSNPNKASPHHSCLPYHCIDQSLASLDL